jgi:RHS repeat-associated protein
LGSSSLITNLDGEIVQHIEYVPFGEVFIEERNNTWNTPYLFNAKELDEETGLYYYGARYYDPRISLWLSTDPLQEKYPNKTPYHYCSNNPINLFDPDGKDDYYSTDGTKLGTVGEGTDIRVVNSEISNKQALEYIKNGDEKSETFLNTNSVAYSDYFISVSDVTNNAALIKYAGNCFASAKSQMEKAGYSIGGADTRIDAKVDNQRQPKLEENPFGASIKIMTDLKNGKPVMVGVEHNNELGWIHMINKIIMKIQGISL